MPSFRVYYEEVRVRGKDLVEKVRSLVHESNVRRIIIKDEKGNTFMEIPLSVATVGAVFMPLIAAVGAIAALVADFTIVLERVEEQGGASAEEPKSPEPVPPSEPPAPPASPAE
jgi:hypothetical protein